MLINIFDKWDTTPVKVKTSYRPKEYSPLEWQVKQGVDHMGDKNWDNSAYVPVNDLGKLEL